MDHHGPADYILHTEATADSRKKCPSSRAQQRRQIACVHRMGIFRGIKVISRFGKLCAAAAASLMDMESEKAGFGFRQSAELGYHQCAVPVR